MLCVGSIHDVMTLRLSMHYVQRQLGHSAHVHVTCMFKVKLNDTLAKKPSSHTAVASVCCCRSGAQTILQQCVDVHKSSDAVVTKVSTTQSRF